MSNVDITGLDKAAVLAALYNASLPQGMGILHYRPEPMSTEQARTLLGQTTYFDYLVGRVMKVDLESDTEFDSWGYDRDLGADAAARVIADLRDAVTA